jgi:hypothetical protein
MPAYLVGHNTAVSSCLKKLSGRLFLVYSTSLRSMLSISHLLDFFYFPVRLAVLSFRYTNTSTAHRVQRLIRVSRMIIETEHTGDNFKRRVNSRILVQVRGFG